MDEYEAGTAGKTLTVVAVDCPGGKADDEEEPVLPGKHAQEFDWVDEGLGLDDPLDIVPMLVENCNAFMAEEVLGNKCQTGFAEICSGTCLDSFYRLSEHAGAFCGGNLGLGHLERGRVGIEGVWGCFYVGPMPIG